jgi:hypothetical protein
LLRTLARGQEIDDIRAGGRGSGEQVSVLELDPELSFFMDASNVCFYGHKQGRLFVYDAPFDELDDIGPIESALEELIERWEAAAPPSAEPHDGPPAPDMGGHDHD